LTRRYGLTIDSLLAVDMVLADGRSLPPAPGKTPESVLGGARGGGNFGVVTSFLFKAHPVHTDYAGPMFVADGRRGRDDAVVSRLQFRTRLPTCTGSSLS